MMAIVSQMLMPLVYKKLVDKKLFKTCGNSYLTEDNNKLYQVNGCLNHLIKDINRSNLNVYLKTFSINQRHELLHVVQIQDISCQIFSPRKMNILYQAISKQ